MGETSEVQVRMNVYQKLQEARVRLQAMELKKSGNNKFAGYQYFELGDFLPAVQNIFKDMGLFGVVSFGETIAELTIVNTEAPEERVVIQSPMAEANLKGCHPIQNLGAVETYQRRYLWVTAMEIVEHDALDAVTGLEDSAPKPQRVPPKAKEKASVAEHTYKPPPATGEIGELEFDDILTRMQEAINHTVLVDIVDKSYPRANKEQKKLIKDSYTSIAAAAGWMS